jgi:hypothetical protein
MKTLNYQLLKINPILETLEDKPNCSYSSLVNSCCVKYIPTGEIIDIQSDTKDPKLLRIINFVDDNDLIVGDLFYIS